MMVTLKSVNKLPDMKGSLQLKNGWLEVLALVALFPFRKGTCDAKNSFEFFVDAMFCFVKICFQERRTSTK